MSTVSYKEEQNLKSLRILTRKSASVVSGAPIVRV